MVNILVILLAISTFAFATISFTLYKRHGILSNIGAIAILNYIAIQPLSGIFHMSGLNKGYRGHFDIIEHGAKEAVFATAAAIIGGICLSAGVMVGKRSYSINIPKSSYWLSNRERIVILIIGTVLVVVALYALSVLASSSALLRAQRIISLDGGLARFSFISHWFAWGVALIALVLVGHKKEPYSLFTLFVIAVCTIAVALSLSWSGGRSIVLVMTLPLILTLWPRLKQLRWLAAIGGVVAMTAYIVSLSIGRSRGLTANTGFEVGRWLDWEWGRFSMTGAAVQYTEQQGFLFGETFVRGGTQAVISALGFLGIRTGNFDGLSSTAVASRVISGDFETIYIVPGLTSELFMNFGIIGVAIGYFLFGMLCNIVQVQLHRCESVINRLFWNYVGVLLIFRIMPSDSGSFAFYLLYSGLPILVLSVLWTFYRKAR